MMENIVQPKLSALRIAERLSALEKQVNADQKETEKPRKPSKDDRKIEERPAKEETNESLLLGGMPLDQEPMVRLMSDLFGENIENIPSRDVQLVAGIIELAQTKVGADLGKVWKFVSTMMHQAPGEKKLRSVYRMLMLGLPGNDSKGGESHDKGDATTKRNNGEPD